MLFPQANRKLRLPSLNIRSSIFSCQPLGNAVISWGWSFERPYLCKNCFLEKAGRSRNRNKNRLETGLSPGLEEHWHPSFSGDTVCRSGESGFAEVASEVLPASERFCGDSNFDSLIPLVCSELFSDWGLCPLIHLPCSQMNSLGQLESEAQPFVLTGLQTPMPFPMTWH